MRIVAELPHPRCLSGVAVGPRADSVYVRLGQARSLRLFLSSASPQITTAAASQSKWSSRWTARITVTFPPRAYVHVTFNTPQNILIIIFFYLASVICVIGT